MSNLLHCCTLLMWLQSTCFKHPERLFQNRAGDIYLLEFMGYHFSDTMFYILIIDSLYQLRESEKQRETEHLCLMKHLSLFLCQLFIHNLKFVHTLCSLI